MAGMGPRGSKASRFYRDESARGRERPLDEQRLIRKGYSGLIFMCSSKTKQDCFLYKVLGLPLAKRNLVEQIVPGTFLFLFDIDVRELHGIFEASSHGGINLESNAFQGQGSYPAQVRFAIYRECLPLPEQVFKPVIQENYYAPNKFQHELTSDQVAKLMQLFHPSEAPRKRLLVDSAASALHDAGGRRLDLLGRSLPATNSLELANRMPPYRLPASGIRLEEGLSRHELILRPEAHPLFADGDRRPVSQARVTDARPEPKNLLIQGRLEEVDELALKYLQPSISGAGRALNSLYRNTSVEAPRAVVSSVEQEAIVRSQALEVERLRRAAVEQTLMREHLSSLRGPSSSNVVSPFSAGHMRAMAVRQAADFRRRR